MISTTSVGLTLLVLVPVIDTATSVEPSQTMLPAVTLVPPVSGLSVSLSCSLHANRHTAANAAPRGLLIDNSSSHHARIRALPTLFSNRHSPVNAAYEETQKSPETAAPPGSA